MERLSLCTRLSICRMAGIDEMLIAPVKSLACVFDAHGVCQLAGCSCLCHRNERRHECRLQHWRGND
jgi:hypothetical protein